MKYDVRALLAGEHRMISIDDTLRYLDGEENNTYIFDDVTFLSLPHVHGMIAGSAGCVSVSLTVSVDYSTHCARCLNEIRDTFSATYERNVVARTQLGDSNEDALDELLIAEDGFISLDEELLEFLILSFPTRVLCAEECKGLCHKCGHNLNEGPCNCDTREIDPRLAPLKKWLDTHKDE